ncbi:MAG: SusC/RagA family TonB-linked outer membrane protein [Gemmatimonadaceae bacterium]|nr:SusC/RagA family TonB-linked outer membrane protein [Gemmatimonadaceae bacterium]
MTAHSTLAVTIAVMLAAVALPSARAQSANAAPVPAPHASGMTPDARPRPTAPPMQRLVALDYSDVPLAVVLDEIDRQAQVALQYTPRTVPVERRVSIHVAGVTVGAALAELLHETDVEVATTPAGDILLVKRAARTRRHVADGVVTGRVVDSATSRPLAGALIAIEGTSLRAATGDDGRYVLRHVPAGTHVVVARLLGYTKATRTITVADSATVTVDFAMQIGFTRLQEVVTTGAGDRERREVGNAVGTINADSIVPTTPLRNLSDLLAGRVAGVQVQTSSGLMGSGSRIRIRGMSNISSTSSDPIMIIDGVRVDARYSEGSAVTLPAAENRVANNGVFMATSRIDDIDPDEIESIDILRGPSAASLYGSDAANGVIVIKTKRGRAGPPRWTFSLDGSRLSMNAKFSEGYAGWGHMLIAPDVRQCWLTGNFVSVANGMCVMDSVTHWNPLNHAETSPFGIGHTARLNAQVSGGSERLQYFLSGSYEDGTDMLKMPDNAVAFLEQERHGEPLPSWQRRPSGLTAARFTNNLTMQLSPRADVALSSSFSRTDHRAANGGPGGFIASGLFSAGVDDSLGGWGQQNPARAFSQLTTDLVDRWIGSLRTTWRPIDAITTHATFGLDYAARTDEVLVRPGDMPDDPVSASGRHDRSQGTATMYSVDLGGSLTLPAWGAWESRSTIGGQYTRSTSTGVTAHGIGLGLGAGTVDGAQERDASEWFDATATAGWYLEQTFSRHGRLYLTAAVRSDVSSAFGKSAKTPLFPKLSASWVISEEPFFPHGLPVSNLRLRAAYGHAGVQPRTDMVFRTYVRGSGDVHGQTVPTITVSSLGNEDLRPERAAELETGLDLGLWNDRVTFEGTFYRKLTRDALMPRTLPSSFGQAARYENVGKIENRGLELTMTATPVQTRLAEWTFTLGMSQNRNKVIAVNGPVTITRGFNSAVPGYAVGGQWDYAIVSYGDANHDGIIEPSEVLLSDSLVYLGQPQPKAEWSMHNSVSLFSGKMTVAAGLDYRSGETQQNSILQQRCTALRCRGLVDPTASLAEQALAVSATMTNYGFMEEVSWLRLYELSVTFRASPRIAQMLHARSASVSIMGRNLGLWSRYRGADPDLSNIPFGEVTTDLGGVPQPREWSIRLNLGF